MRSFFKNPVVEKVYFDSLKAAFEEIPGYVVDEGSVKLPAAWLIDQCGWKGTRIGDIGVHDKQALVLVNHGNGKGKDILKLSTEIQKSVFPLLGWSWSEKSMWCKYTAPFAVYCEEGWLSSIQYIPSSDTAFINDSKPTGFTT